MSALLPNVRAYQSPWYIQAKKNCPEPGLRPVSPSGASSLVACSLVCLWQSPVVFHECHSSRCQSQNRKSHGEDLLINTDPISARQRTECVEGVPVMVQVRDSLTAQKEAQLLNLTQKMGEEISTWSFRKNHLNWIDTHRFRFILFICF